MTGIHRRLFCYFSCESSQTFICPGQQHSSIACPRLCGKTTAVLLCCRFMYITFRAPAFRVARDNETMSSLSLFFSPLLEIDEKKTTGTFVLEVVRKYTCSAVYCCTFSCILRCCTATAKFRPPEKSPFRTWGTPAV